MRRRAVIRYRPSGKVASLADVYRKLQDTWHLHFCINRDCRVIFECNHCTDVAKNVRCHRCAGRERPQHADARDPKDCCLGNCRQVTDKEDLLRYRLAGPGPWFQCTTCARCHGWPCNPTERKP